MKKKLSLLLMSLLLSTPAFAQNGVWINDLRTIFDKNQAIIMAVNIRTFNANDKNNNEIIEIEKGETPGNFVNAVQRLDGLKKLGINTIHLLPITPVGKVKAIGTAGSLYAISSFNEINPQLDDKTNNLTVKQEAANFIRECHKRGIRVIIDLPSCGSYDMYLANPNLFETDTAARQPQVPADWTDVRMFKTQNADGSLNEDVYNLYKQFVDMVLELDADGIRADVATSKPYAFWERLIKYTREKSPQFLFLAEASESWTEPVTKSAPFTPYDKLLEAGFDGYYGSFFNFKDWKTSEEFEKQMNLVTSIQKQYNYQRSVIGSFSTHDEISPIVLGGPQITKQIIWLQATLPVNSYFVDGFQSGDAYLYKYANQKAAKTYTDDDYYYVHKGKIDIFNFSRKPGGKDSLIQDEFIIANSIKKQASEMMQKGNITFLNTTNPDVFAYMLTYDKSSIIVILNKNLQRTSSADIKCNVSTKTLITPVRTPAPPTLKNGKLSVNIPAGEIIVMLADLSKK